MWSLVQADGTWSPQHLLGVEFLGHCGVQFRLTGVGSPLDPCGFGFGAFWGSVHADEIWSPPYLLGVEPGRLRGSIQADGMRSPQDLVGVHLWDIVGFS